MHTVHRLFGPWQQIGGINTLDMERHINAQNVLILVSIENLTDVVDTYRTEPAEIDSIILHLGSKNQYFTGTCHPDIQKSCCLGNLITANRIPKGMLLQPSGDCSFYGIRSSIDVAHQRDGHRGIGILGCRQLLTMIMATEHASCGYLGGISGIIIK